MAGLAGAVLIGTACAAFLHARASGEYLMLRKVIFATATHFEKWSFDHALKSGPYTFQTFLDHFWEERDPTAYTPYNEFRTRFEARLWQYRFAATPPGGDGPDDRIIAYVFYGEPSSERRIREKRTYTRIDWIYEPPAEAAGAGAGHDALENLAFRVAFRVSNGTYTLCPLIRKPWSRQHQRRLFYHEIRELADLVMDEGTDPGLGTLAVWRLRMEESAQVFRLLLTCAAAVMNYSLYHEIEEAVAPLLLVREEGSAQASAVLPADEANEPDRPAGVPTRVTTVSAGSTVAADPAAADSVSTALLARVYDPGWLFEPETVEEMQRAAATGDSALRIHGWLEPEEAAALYVGPLARARELLDSERPMDAHTFLQPFLHGELSGHSEAWHLDALALMESDSPGGRQLSETRIRQAMRLDPGNLRYLLSLARILYRRTFAYYADDVLDHVLDRAPTLAAAYALKAIIRMEYYWKLGWRASPWSTPLEESPQVWSGYESTLHLSAYRATATDMINRALILDPDDLYASWWLGVHYLTARQWGAAVPVMNYLIENGVHTAEAYLGRGMCFQHLGLIDQAMADYEAGLARLPDTVRPLADDPRWVQLPSEGGIAFTERITPRPGTAGAGTPPTGAGADTAGQASRELFWRSLDPLFSTELNERVLEQHRRFAYVTWFFAVPNLGLRGWESHRGRIYLRYGEPQEYQAIENALGWRNLTAEDLLAIGDDDIRWEDVARMTRNLNLARTWTYPGIRFRFNIGMITGNFVLSDPARAEQEIEQAPASVRIEGVRTVFFMDFTWYAFQDDGGAPEWIPAARIPALSWRIAGTDWTTSTVYPISYLLLDATWNVVATFRHDFPIAAYLMDQGGDWVGPTLRLPDDVAAEQAKHVAVELFFTRDIPAYASRDSLPGIPDRGLRLSSLVPARGVVEGEAVDALAEGSWIIRDGRAIAPVQGEVYPPDEPLYLYFETYGLARDEVGATSWQVALSITSLEEEKPPLNPIVEALGHLVSRRTQEGTVTLIFDRGGIETRAAELLRVVPPEASPTGMYRVDIEVEDRITGQKAARSLRLILSR